MLGVDVSLDVSEKVLPKDIARKNSCNPSEPVGRRGPGVWRPDRACGKAMVTYVEQAVKRLLAGTLDAVTTCPINKQAMNEAGYLFAGHTEFLAHLAGVPSVAMMFWDRNGKSFW